MSDLAYFLTALQDNTALYVALLIGVCLGCILGILGSSLLWNRTCKAYEDDAELHLDLALDAIREKNQAIRANAVLAKQNEFLTSVLAGERDPDDFSHLPRDIQFPPQ